VAFFDCLHGMGDPAGASKHVRESLAPGGTWMIVEPFVHDTIAANLNPVGRINVLGVRVRLFPEPSATSGSIRELLADKHRAFEGIEHFQHLQA
jgi:hypothetical protein